MELIILAAVLFAFSAFSAIVEAIQEKDWPRETFKFVLIFGAGLAILLIAAFS